MAKETDPRVKLTEFPNCSHHLGGPVAVMVLGKAVALSTSLACKECLEPYLNKVSILCVICQNPILPLQHVTANLLLDSGAEGRAHVWCGPVGCLDGIWGEGHLIPLNGGM